MKKTIHERKASLFGAPIPCAVAIPLLVALFLSLFCKHAFATCYRDYQCEVKIARPIGQKWSDFPLTTIDKLSIESHASILNSDGKPGSIQATGGSIYLGEHLVLGDVYAQLELHTTETARMQGKIYATKALNSRNMPAFGPDSFAFPERKYRELILPFELPSKFQRPILKKSGDIVELPDGSRSKRIAVQSDSVLRLKSGIYFIDNFETLPNSLVSFDVENGTSIVFVLENFSHRGRFDFQGDKPDVLFVFLGESDITIESEFDANLIAPYAKVRFTPKIANQHDAIIYSKSLIVGEENRLKAHPISMTGPGFDALKSRAEEQQQDHDELFRNQYIGFTPEIPDTNAGRLLKSTLEALFLTGPESVEIYLDSLQKMREASDEVIPLIGNLYHSTPEILETADWRYQLVMVLGDMVHEDGFKLLKSISESPINEAIKELPVDHHFVPTQGEYLVRANAVTGLTRLGQANYKPAIDALKQQALHSDGMLQRYAVFGYLKSGDQASRRNELLSSLADQDRHLVDMTTELIGVTDMVSDQQKMKNQGDDKSRVIESHPTPKM